MYLCTTSVLLCIIRPCSNICRMELIQWPLSTAQWCYHCAQPIQHRPIPVPRYYDTDKHVFIIEKYVCCSWQCVKAVTHDTGLFYRRCTGRWPQSFSTMPHRQCLREFGGNLTYDRIASNKCYELQHLPPMTYISPRYQEGVFVLGKGLRVLDKKREESVSRAKPSASPACDDPVDLTQAPASNIDQIKLKKAKRKSLTTTSHHDIISLMKK